MSDRAPPPGYMPTLDGWRALAISAVIMRHATEPLFHEGGPHASPILYELTRRSGLGVQIFFGLSGFLICSRLVTEIERRGTLRVGDFYARRALRLLPAYFVYLAVVSAFASTGAIAVSGREMVSCLLFFRNYVPMPEGAGWFTGHFWSLSVEEHFYLLWPAFLLLAGLRRAPVLVIGAGLAIGLWRVIEFRAGLLSGVLVDVGFYRRTDVRLDSLLFGCALALLLARRGARPVFQRWLSSWRWWLVAAAFLACVTLHPPLKMTWEALLVPPLVAGTVLAPGTRVGRILESKPLRFVGRISYGLYLWQQFFFVPSHVARPLPLTIFQEWPLNLPTVFACAIASHYLIERPVSRLGRRLLAALRAPARGGEVLS